MRYDSCQFQSFDGLDNRRELMILLQRLGQHLPEPLANERRAQWLESLMAHSQGALNSKPIKLPFPERCDPVRAYQIIVAITGVLGVPIDKAARMLDREVSRQ